MKLIVYMAMSVNGYIARTDNATDFVSKTEWKSFKKMIGKTGNMVVGRKTYGIMKAGKEFKGLQNIRVVVVSKTGNVMLANKKHATVTTPNDAIALLKKEKFKTALIAGGGKLNASFMKQNLVDEMYLDIESVALGKGVPLFSDEDFFMQLKLEGVKKLSANEVQLHYKKR
ncbi:dihydrofolate reductase [Candidatus Woesearchaeota archaeon]|nr:MAG: dihydrofolate reductase [Candidatus Woesearchaeota archaeon]